jgi:hypothetical protein
MSWEDFRRKEGRTCETVEEEELRDDNKRWRAVA